MIRWLRAVLLLGPRYEYGLASDDRRSVNARRDIITGEIQFVLWRKGERGHTKDFWYPIGAGRTFIPTEKKA